MSSGLRTSVVRPAQYTPSRPASPTASSASANVTTVPTGIVRPRLRSTRANATAISTDDSDESAAGGPSGTGHGLAHEVAYPRCPHALLILAVLEHRAQGDVDGVLVQLQAAEGGEGGRPVDRLGHS